LEIVEEGLFVSWLYEDAAMACGVWRVAHGFGSGTEPEARTKLGRIEGGKRDDEPRKKIETFFHLPGGSGG
jgi:hypothetical protein